MLINKRVAYQSMTLEGSRQSIVLCRRHKVVELSVVPLQLLQCSRFARRLQADHDALPTLDRLPADSSVTFVI